MLELVRVDVPEPGGTYLFAGYLDDNGVYDLLPMEAVPSVRLFVFEVRPQQGHAAPYIIGSGRFEPLSHCRGLWWLIPADLAGQAQESIDLQFIEAFLAATSPPGAPLPTPEVFAKQLETGTWLRAGVKLAAWRTRLTRLQTAEVVSRLVNLFKTRKENP
jgi:hypothetical protein